MKKFIVVSFAALALAACGGNDSKDSKEQKTTDSSNVKKDEGSALSSNPDYQKGLDLIGQSDCLTCHRIDETLQGPAYRDVANKYASYPDSIVGHLASKIIRGGNDGVWNMPGTMTPHPTLKEDDAKAMVKYILLLKK